MPPAKKKVAKKKPKVKKKAVVKAPPKEIDRCELVLPSEITGTVRFNFLGNYEEKKTVIFRPWAPHEIKKRKSVITPLVVIQIDDEDGDLGASQGFALRKTVLGQYSMNSQWRNLALIHRAFEIWAYMSRQSDKRILKHTYDHYWASTSVNSFPWSDFADSIAESLVPSSEWWKSSRVTVLMIHKLPDPKKKPAKKAAKKAGLVKAHHG